MKKALRAFAVWPFASHNISGAGESIIMISTTKAPEENPGEPFDYGCSREDLLRKKNVLTRSTIREPIRPFL